MRRPLGVAIPFINFARSYYDQRRELQLNVLRGRGNAERNCSVGLRVFLMSDEN